MKDEHQRNLVKLFDGLCNSHPRWEVWSDFIVMTAIAISNAVDLSQRDEREQSFLAIEKKYKESEQETFAKMFAEIVLGMEQDPDQDFLGELYMNLNLGNNRAGQFFTPYSVCKMMAMMNADHAVCMVEENGWTNVNDPTCGAGALLVAFANMCRDKKIDYHTRVLFTAQDLEYVTGCMCYIQLSLLGCPGYVVIANTLTHPATSVDDRGLIPSPGQTVWYTPLYFHEVWDWRRRFWLLGQMGKISPKKKQAEMTQPTASALFSESETGQLTLF